MAKSRLGLRVLVLLLSRNNINTEDLPRKEKKAGQPSQAAVKKEKSAVTTKTVTAVDRREMTMHPVMPIDLHLSFLIPIRSGVTPFHHQHQHHRHLSLDPVRRRDMVLDPRRHCRLRN